MKTRITDLSVNGFPEHSASSTEVPLLLNLGKHPKNFTLPTACSPKATFNF